MEFKETRSSRSSGQMYLTNAIVLNYLNSLNFLNYK